MKRQRKSSSRLSKADMQALYQLDRILEEERRIEKQYALPFRAPARVATSLQQCSHCRKDIALLIFGDNAKDVAGLEAYARMMAEPIKGTNLPTYVIAPPSDPGSPDNPALLLKVYPAQEDACFITPDEWEILIKKLSDAHCGCNRV